MNSSLSFEQGRLINKIYDCLPCCIYFAWKVYCLICFASCLFGAISLCAIFSGEASKFIARIKSHMVFFTVISSAPPEERRASVLSSDIFTLALPHISADGAYRPPEKIDIDKMEDENLQYREGGYIDVVLIVGNLSMQAPFTLLEPKYC